MDAKVELARKALKDMGLLPFVNKVEEGALKTSRKAKSAAKRSIATVAPRGDRGKPKSEPTYRTSGKQDAAPTLVPVSELKIDERYQFHPEKEDGRIASFHRWLMAHGGYSPSLAGAIHVSVRSNGDMYVVDGYGRVWMGTKMVVNPITHIPAILHNNLLTWEEEAQLFIELNRHKRKIKLPHLFVVAANAGREPEASLMKIVLNAGYAIERVAHKKGAIIAPSALLFANELGHDVLEKALFDLRHTWGDDKSVDGRIVVVLTALHAAYPKISQERLRKVLTQGNWTAKQALAQARAEAQTVITSRSPQSRDTNPYLARNIIKWYNYRLEKKEGVRLDPRKLDDLQDKFAAEELHKDVWDFRV